MTRIAIITDSSADLAPHIAESAGITVIPTGIVLGAEAIRNRAPALWAGQDPPWTVEPPDALPQPEMIDAFASAFAGLTATHDAVVAVLLSSRLGGSVEAAMQARERVSTKLSIEVVDSRSASLGVGFQAVRAAELARQGMGAATIAVELRAEMDRYHVVFCVESVEHLRQSGQIGRSAAMIAEALQLKPLLRIDEGQIVPYERARTRARAIAELADFVCELPAVERCAVLYATNRNDANRLVKIIAVDTGLSPERLTVDQIGTVVAARVGPGALGVAVVESDIR